MFWNNLTPGRKAGSFLSRSFSDRPPESMAIPLIQSRGFFYNALTAKGGITKEDGMAV